MPVKIATLEKRTTSTVALSTSIKIIDQRSYNKAVDAFTAAKELKDQIIEHHKPMKTSAYNTWQEVIAAEKKLLVPAQQAYDALSRMIGAWDEEQKQIAANAQRVAEAAAATALEESKQRSAAEAHKQGADEDEVDAILQAPTPRPKMSAITTYAKSSDVSSRKRYSAIPLLAAPVKGDPEKAKRALIKLAAKNPDAWAQYLTVNTSALDRRAADQKEAFTVPGAYQLATETKAQPRGGK